MNKMQGFTIFTLLILHGVASIPFFEQDLDPVDATEELIAATTCGYDDAPKNTLFLLPNITAFGKQGFIFVPKSDIPEIRNDFSIQFWMLLASENPSLMGSIGRLIFLKSETLGLYYFPASHKLQIAVKTNGNDQLFETSYIQQYFETYKNRQEVHPETTIIVEDEIKDEELEEEKRRRDSDIAHLEHIKNLENELAAWTARKQQQQAQEQQQQPHVHHIHEELEAKELPLDQSHNMKLLGLQQDQQVQQQQLQDLWHQQALLQQQHELIQEQEQLQVDPEKYDHVEAEQHCPSPLHSLVMQCPSDLHFRAAIEYRKRQQENARKLQEQVIRNAQILEMLSKHWIHVAIVVSNQSHISVYLNGVVHLDVWVNIEIHEKSMYIGKFPTYNGDSAMALMTRFFHTNYALSDAEIQKEMENRPTYYIESLQFFQRAVQMESQQLLVESSKLLEAADQLMTRDDEQSLEEALQHYDAASQLGHPKAMFQLGQLFFSGEFVQQNLSLAFEFMNESAHLGNADAQQFLGFFYMAGVVVARNISKALEWYNLAALGGSIEAAISLGNMYHSGLGVESQCEVASMYYILASNQASAQFRKRNHIVETTFLEEDVAFGNDGEDDDLIRLQEYYAEAGDAQAQLNMGEIHYFGLRGLPQNYDHALRYFRMAVDQDHPRAMSRMAEMYLKGEGVDKNTTTAAKYIEQAAKKNDSMGLNMMGYLYANGVANYPQNYTTALKYFKMSADKNFSSAMTNMGVFYQEGMGTQINAGKALHYFTEAAVRGERNAMFHAGHLYLQGRGAPQSCDAGVVWLRVVAEFGSWGKVLRRALNCYLDDNMDCSLALYMYASYLGYAAAQRNTAWLMSRGICLEDDVCDAAAYEYYKMAFENDIADNHVGILLGDYHYYGVGGMEVNATRAFLYYAQVADESTEPQAHFNVAYMYQYGIGVEQNTIRAEWHYMQMFGGQEDELMGAEIAAIAGLGSLYLCPYFGKVCRYLFVDGSGVPVKDVLGTFLDVIDMYEECILVFLLAALGISMYMKHRGRRRQSV